MIVQRAAAALVLRLATETRDEAQRQLGPDIRVCLVQRGMVATVGSPDPEALAREYGTEVRAPRPWGRKSLAAARRWMEARHADDRSE